MDLDSFYGQVKPKLPVSFSKDHLCLLRIVFGDIKCDKSKMEKLNEELLSPSDVMNMSRMVKVEFQSSLHKEITRSDDSNQKLEPKPYDIFLMKNTLDRPHNHLAISLPVRKSQDLLWYNGGVSLHPLDSLTSKRKVASLSGPARILQNLNAATSSLTSWSMSRSMIQSPVDDFDDLIDGLKLGDLANAKIGQLNESQRQAVATVASPTFRSGFFAVQGPPGCGKTTCMVSMILALKRDVLVVAPSNAAVANIALKVYETKQFDHKNIVVFGENSDPSAHFLSPTHRGNHFKKMFKKYKIAGKERNPEKQSWLLKDFLSWLHVDDHDTKIEDLFGFCEVFSHRYGERVKQLKQHIRSAKLVFATLNSAASPILQRNANCHTILLDEAGQTTEAEFFIATNFPGVERIVQVGDPAQLPATVIDNDCLIAGYGMSWMSKIKKFQPDKVHLLDVQYRMDPKILYFPNSNFYGDQISSGINVMTRAPYIERPFCFIDTSGQGSEKMEECSWKNVYEAELIQSLMYTDLDIKTLLLSSSQQKFRIMVITPYRSQAKLLRETISVPNNCTLDIGTVDSMQGQEGDIVIVSTVRTNKLGFIDNRNRINVAITRAKRILRVIGDAEFFRKNSGSTLKKICDYAESVNSIQKSALDCDQSVISIQKSTIDDAQSVIPIQKSTLDSAQSVNLTQEVAPLYQSSVKSTMPPARGCVVN